MAIELSGHVGSVALGPVGDEPGAGMPLICESVHQQSRHDDDLMPAIQRLFLNSPWPPSSLSHVYLSIGPGGFTGLRVATATAKMLAFSLGARIFAIPTALVVAADVPPSTHAADHLEQAGLPRTLAVCLARKRGRYWTQLFTLVGDNSRDRGTGSADPNRIGTWRPMSTQGRLLLIDQIASVPGLTDLALNLDEQDFASTKDIITCHQWADLASIDDRNLARACCESNPEAVIHPARPQASTCWQIGDALASGPAASSYESRPQDLTPLYAREPEAVILWANRHRAEMHPNAD